MKYFFYLFLAFFIILSLLTCIANGQQNTIIGIVSIFNSKTNTGIKQYVANAFVKDQNNLAQPAITNNQGFFSLIYLGQRIGTTVYFNIEKEDLEVVEISSLHAVLGQSDTIRISLATPNEIADYRNNIYDVGQTTAQKRLSALINYKNNQLNKLRKDSIKQSILIAQFKKDLMNLEAERNNIQIQAEQLADRYSTVNLDDAVPAFQSAFKQFQLGNLDSAIQILNTANLTASVNEINIEENKINFLDSEVSKRKINLFSKKANLLTALQFKADLYRIGLMYDSAYSTYLNMLLLDSNNIQTLDNFAHYCSNQNKLDKAINLCKKILSLHVDSVFFAETLGNCSAAFFKKNQMDSAKAYAEKELTLINLKNGIGKLDSSIYFFEKAHELLEVLVHTDSSKYEFYRLENLFYIAEVFSNINNFDSANFYFSKTDLLDSIFIKNPIKYKEEFSRYIYKYGYVDLLLNKTKLANTKFLIALSLIDSSQLKSNSEAVITLAYSLFALGVINQMSNNYDSARYYYLKSFNLIRSSLEFDDFDYQKLLALITNNIAIIYRDDGDIKNSIIFFMLALPAYEFIEERNTYLYKDKINYIKHYLNDYRTYPTYIKVFD